MTQVLKTNPMMLTGLMGLWAGPKVRVFFWIQFFFWERFLSTLF